MLNYTIMSTERLAGHPSRVHDVLSDLRIDLRGLSATMMAVSEQPFEVLPEQLATFSELLSRMEEAVGDVLATMDAEHAASTKSNNRGAIVTHADVDGEVA